MDLRNRAILLLGIAAFVLGTVGAFLFAGNVAADHKLTPGTSHLTAANLNALTTSDTAWMWGCIVVAFLGAVTAVVMIVRARRWA